jgi:SNF2 family DNA or RNA helicase
VTPTVTAPASPINDDDDPYSTAPPTPIKKHPSKIRPGVEYKNHQVRGIRWLARRSSWLLCDDQGLGKTLMSLSVAALDFDRGWASKVLVICDASLKDNWGDEIDKWSTFTWEVLDGRDPGKRRAKLAAFDREILIVNYEQVMAHPNELLAMGFDIIIVDECQAIRNYEAKRTQAVHRLTAKRWFLLSGTPLDNRPNELWSPLRLADPDNTPAYWTWVNAHCVFAPKSKVVVGVKKAEKLRRHIDQLFLRRLKGDCLDLPDKQRIKINVELSPYQRRLHDQAEKELILQLPQDPEPMDLESGLMKALRLRQICSTPANVEGLEDDSAKLDAVIAKLRELNDAGLKAVVFTQFRPTIDCLLRRCEAEGIKTWAHHGGIPRPQRQVNVRDWSAHEGPAVMIGMYQTMGRGLTLTAARHVLIVDKLYTPGGMSQAEDRCHRIGADETQPVQIIEFIARRTHEQRIEQILDAKGEMIAELIPNSGWKKKIYQLILEGSQP